MHSRIILGEIANGAFFLCSLCFASGRYFYNGADAVMVAGCALKIKDQPIVLIAFAALLS